MMASASSSAPARPFHAVMRDEPIPAIDFVLCAVLAVAVVTLLFLAL